MRNFTKIHEQVYGSDIPGHLNRDDWSFEIKRKKEMEIYNMQEESISDMDEFDICVCENIFQLSGKEVVIEYKSESFEIPIIKMEVII